MLDDAPVPSDNRVGLSLSGGGFRATLYHCGALIRLNELGYLPKLDRISSVSGGSITSARLAARWNALDFDANGVATNLEHEVIEPLRAFCRQTLDLRVILAGLIPFTRSATKRLTDAYDTQLLDGMTLDRLPKRPEFIFNSTNLETGRNLRFGRTRVVDDLVGEIRDTSSFRVAQAVAASSAFPPVLSPVTIKAKQSAWTDLPGTKFFGKPKFMTKVELADGALYDNLGLSSIHQFGTILCSDAGRPFPYHGMPGFRLFSPRQLLRSQQITLDQVVTVRLSSLFSLQKFTGQTVACWGTDMGKTTDAAPSLLPRSEDVVERIATLRTRLNKFNATEQGLLLNWGYASCDERVRSYVLKDAPPPVGLPVPGVRLT